MSTVPRDREHWQVRPFYEAVAGGVFLGLVVVGSLVSGV